jgi:hypothetical protein
MNIFVYSIIVMINFKSLHDEKFTLMYFKGVVTPEDVISFIDSLVRDSEYHPEYNSLVDLRDAELVYDLEGMKRTLKHMQSTPGFTSNRKTAYITSASTQVVPPTLMNSGLFSTPMKVKVFSSVTSAMK